MKDKLCNEQSYTLSNVSFFKTPKLHSSFFWKSVSRICRRGKSCTGQV